MTNFPVAWSVEILAKLIEDHIISGRFRQRFIRQWWWFRIYKDDRTISRFLSRTSVDLYLSIVWDVFLYCQPRVVVWRCPWFDSVWIVWNWEYPFHPYWLEKREIDAVVIELFLLTSFVLHKTKRGRFRRCWRNSRSTRQETDGCGRLSDNCWHFLLRAFLVAQRLQEFALGLIRLFDVANLFSSREQHVERFNRIFLFEGHLLDADFDFRDATEHLIGEHFFGGDCWVIGDQVFTDMEQCIFGLLQCGKDRF